MAKKIVAIIGTYRKGKVIDTAVSYSPIKTLLLSLRQRAPPSSQGSSCPAHAEP